MISFKNYFIILYLIPLIFKLKKAIQKTYHEKKHLVVLCKNYILQVMNRKLLSFVLAAKVFFRILNVKF